MMEGLDNSKDTADDGSFLPSFVPHLFDDVASAIGSFDDADEPLNSGGETFVSPHWVDEYVTKAGNIIDGFWRDGDGDTSIDLTENEGGGYFRSIT